MLVISVENFGVTVEKVRRNDESRPRRGRNEEEATGTVQQDERRGLSGRESATRRFQERRVSMTNEVWLEARHELVELQTIERKTVLMERSSTTGWS
jgi:hypothetical protein